MNIYSLNYFYITKIQFPNLDISKISPVIKIQKAGNPNNNCIPQQYTCNEVTCFQEKHSCLDISNSNIISCYETTTNFIVCFYQKISYYYSIIIYTENLNFLLESDLYYGDTNSYNFFKCIHFFNKTGIFAYFSSDANSSIIFQFKDYNYKL